MGRLSQPPNRLSAARITWRLFRPDAFAKQLSFRDILLRSDYANPHIYPLAKVRIHNHSLFFLGFDLCKGGRWRENARCKPPISKEMHSTQNSGRQNDISTKFGDADNQYKPPKRLAHHPCGKRNRITDNWHPSGQKANPTPTLIAVLRAGQIRAGYRKPAFIGLCLSHAPQAPINTRAQNIATPSDQD